LHAAGGMSAAVLLVWLEVARGGVVAIQGPTVIVDLGTERALRAESKIGLYRSVEVKHPRTGRKLRDEFFLSTVDVAELGKSLSILRPPAEVLRELTVGDTAVVSDPEPPASARPAAAPAAPAACPDAGECRT
jgi:hypothetical protein